MMAMTMTGISPEVSRLLDERLGERSTRIDQKLLRSLSVFSPTRLNRYLTSRNYYEGVQGTILTDRAKTYLERSGLPYTENFCATVVDALAERLNVVGVTSDLADTDPDTGEVDDELADWLWEQFDRNRGDELQATVHTEAAEVGDAYVIVDWDTAKSRPRLTWNVSEAIEPHYENGSLMFVVKCWTTTALSPTNPTGMECRRMNIYFPGRVEKWFTLAKDSEQAEWTEWLDDGDTTWPVAWVDKAGDPLGIPVFHFANQRASDMFGRPEHWGTIPQQDRLNKELIDLAAVMDSQGFPQRYALGMSDVSTLTTDPGTVWAMDIASGTFGQFPSADPSGPLKAVESTLIRIATRSRTPAHLIYLSGGLPSGESLKTAEAGLVAKAKKRQVYYGGVWVETFRMMSLVAATFGSGEEAPPYDIAELREATVNVKWADPETRNEKEHLDSLTVMKTLGVSEDTILSMIPGIDPAEEREKKERDAEAKKQAAGDMLLNGDLTPEDVVIGGPVAPKPNPFGG